MFSFQPIGRDFGDKPAESPNPAHSSSPANPGNTDSDAEGKNSATSQQTESADSPPIPDDFPSGADLAKAFNLSLAACGLFVQMSNSGVPNPADYYVPPSTEAPSHYSLRPAHSLKPTWRAQAAMRRK
ncbi:hypothetical protein MD484_g1363, partial [Candolleomyces efflorescens]